MTRLTGKTALITGGSTGIGLATARLFLDEGARVAITGQNPERLSDTAASLGDGELAIRADVARPADIDAMVDTVRQQFGRLDVLFVNAGIARLGSVDAVTEDVFDAVFAVNVKGAFFTIQNAAALMGEGGSVVVNTSANNRMGMAGSSVYSASKAAARSLVRTLGGELIHRGIRVNAVSPGPVETPIYGKLGVPGEQLEAFAGQLRQEIPMHRFGRLEEIARAALFLASDESSFVLGQELVADGGWTAI